ncbi:MAG: ribosome biogenesis factor YjgA [Gammaproteobacteria bacterium]
MKRRAAKPPGPSKSQRKRESDALQALGEVLIDLPADALADAPIEEDLREAVMLARGLRKHGALRRQRQYIGKLMRQIESPQALQVFLQRRADLQQRDRQRFHALERWRDRIIDEGAAAIDACAADTGADPSELRALAATVRDQNDDAQRKRAGRALFRYLNDLGQADDEHNSEG